jgi:hypothetical protein
MANFAPVTIRDTISFGPEYRLRQGLERGMTARKLHGFHFPFRWKAESIDE